MDNKMRGRAIEERNINMRKQFWSSITEEHLWDKKKSKGFIALPRPMPLFHLIMDKLSVGAPLSSTYFALWCRNWDQNVVTIESQQTLAAESGFMGQRAVSAWKNRIKKLEVLGFIKTAPGSSHEYQYILLLNPYFVVKELYKKNKIDKNIYNSLIERSLKIGSTELS